MNAVSIYYCVPSVLYVCTVTDQLYRTAYFDLPRHPAALQVMNLCFMF